MANIEIYTTKNCPNCLRAKQLLERRGLTYSEYLIAGDRERMREMLKRCRQKSVPQIFIDDVHIGDYLKLTEFDSEGGLSALSCERQDG